MLIEFTVENFRSIRDEQKISMMATSATEHENTHISHNVAPGVDRLLKSAVIYGANAAGKTNILLALDVMSDIVTKSSSDQAGKVLEHINTFCLDNKSHGVTKFEVVFVADSVKYQYGFTANASRIFEEWLYAFPEKRSQEWFSRDFNLENKETTWRLGGNLKGKKTLWSDSTRENALFLSTAASLNATQLLPVYNFFSKHLHVITSGELNSNFSINLLSDIDSRERLTNFLIAADTGITDLATRPKKPNPVHLKFLDMLEDGELKRSMLEAEEVEVAVKHLDSDGNDVWLSMDHESRGTQKLFSFAGPIIDVLKNGHIFLVDELNNSLHPLLVKKLVSVFHDKSVNTSGAQLIFTTHASSILDFDIFRRDQIWFVEKDASGASRLYPLTDFSPRKDTSLEKGYLLGRYGAIPFISQGLF